MIGKKLTYCQDEISSNRNVGTSNDEFELINQNDNSIVTVSVKDTNKGKTKSYYENQRRAQKVILKNLQIYTILGLLYLF